MHILSVSQLSPEFVSEVFIRADTVAERIEDPNFCGDLRQIHAGRAVCSLFYEPSTRTRLSFERAAQTLGACVVGTENAGEFSSASKGETIEDTIRVLAGYNLGAIILRHPETGLVERAAKVSEVPVINAGDGKGEHPTQALLDLYTIRQKFGDVKGLEVVMGGDLANGRTVHSLAKLLADYGVKKIVFVSTPELQITDEVKGVLGAKQISYELTEEMRDAVKTADVVYWTRLQKERMQDTNDITDDFVIDLGVANLMPKESIIMHPLPRVGEIACEVDNDPRAWYFEQAHNGFYVRTAILDLVLSGKHV